jgi:hypothetical protein
VGATRFDDRRNSRSQTRLLRPTSAQPDEQSEWVATVVVRPPGRTPGRCGRARQMSLS